MNKKTIATIVALCTTASLTAAAAAGEYTTSWGTISSVETVGSDVKVRGLDLSPNPATPHVGLARALCSRFGDASKARASMLAR
jgi:hypothetical protein